MLVQTSSDSPDELLREMWKAEHIFRELGNQYQFSISTASNLPLLVSSPLHIPEDRDFLCLFGCALNKDLSIVQHLYSCLEQRALSMKPNTADLFNQQECLCVETMAHFFRQRATVEPNANLRRQLFDKAYKLYRCVIYTCSHSSLTAIVEDVKSMSKKISLVCPVPDMHRFSSEGRRRVAHCLAGMALCSLMGCRDPMLCFGLSSAAVMWEPVRRLEMANFLRMNLLLVGRFHLGLCSVSVPGKRAGESWEFVTNSMETIDALMGFGGSTLVNVPAVYDAMNKQIVLPAVILHGSATMLERERELIQVDDWEEVRTLVGVLNLF